MISIRAEAIQHAAPVFALMVRNVEQKEAAVSLAWLHLDHIDHVISRARYERQWEAYFAPRGWRFV